MVHYRMSWTTLAMFVVVAVLVALPSASSIKCFQCNSIKDPHCKDVKVNIAASRTYLRECEDPNIPPGQTFFCRKMVQTVIAAGETRVIRKCGFVNATRPCYHYDDKDHSETVCQCFDEACNAADATARPSLRKALVAASATTLLLLLAR